MAKYKHAIGDNRGSNPQRKTKRIVTETTIIYKFMCDGTSNTSNKNSSEQNDQIASTCIRIVTFYQ